MKKFPSGIYFMRFQGCSKNIWDVLFLRTKTLDSNLFNRAIPVQAIGMRLMAAVWNQQKHSSWNPTQKKKNLEANWNGNIIIQTIFFSELFRL